MLKTQIDNYDMNLAVENFMDDNESVWSGNVPITETKELLSKTIDDLAEQVGIQLTNPTGVTVDKERARKTLVEEAFVISSAASAYASIIDNGALRNRTYYAISTLERFRDAELHSVCTNLLSDCQGVGRALEPYGITSVVLSDFQVTTDRFAAIMKNPTEAIARRKAATDKIPVILSDISILLNTRMDNLMVGLQASAPDFVAQYTNIRAVNNTGTRELSLTILSINAETREPIANVALELVGQGIKRVSSKRGYNTVAHLMSGSHDIAALHPNYQPKTVTFTVVSGETTELVLLLEPK